MTKTKDESVFVLVVLDASIRCQKHLEMQMIVKIQRKRKECSKVGGIQIEAGRNAFEGDWT